MRSRKLFLLIICSTIFLISCEPEDLPSDDTGTQRVTPNYFMETGNEHNEVDDDKSG